MLTHHVLFWLKADTTETQKNNFRKGLESLSGIATIRNLHIGTAAPIERAVVDTSYTFSLLIFPDLSTLFFLILQIIKIQYIMIFLVLHLLH